VQETIAMSVASKTSPLTQIQALGQSIWMDFMSRPFATPAELGHLIEEDDLRGCTSNPTIFDGAIRNSSDYDTEIEAMARAGKSAQEIYDALTIADIQTALDLFRPTYDRTQALDGYVSLEVSPVLARDGEQTASEAKRLWDALDRPNAMIKIPGTVEGLPAIEASLFAGININVTLLFAVDAYEAVARAYVKALMRRAEAGLPLDRIASVASFFVSRIDAETDKRIDAKIATETDAAKKAELESLKGKLAIANAKAAYRVYQEIFEGPEFAPLKARGARPQRVLWASVGVKNPAYPDTLYIDELIGPDTVSTMPPETYNATKDHGTVRNALLDGLDSAPATIARLDALGISFKAITDHLLDDGIKKFVQSFEHLMKSIEEKRAKFTR
jgi:transaldolase